MLTTVFLRRVRVYATLIGATLWLVWLVNCTTPGAIDRLGKVKGTDFLQFYVAGSLVRERQLPLLYNANEFAARTHAVAPGSRETVYLPVQSPQVALVFSAFSRVSYTAAVAAWVVIIALLYAAASVVAWMQCAALRPFRHEAIACAVAFPAFYSTVLNGQTSAVSLLAFAAGLWALRQHRSVTAGLMLGCLVFKPHWLIVTAAVFAAASEWRVVGAMCASAAAQTAITCAVVGATVMRDYARALLAIQQMGDLLEPYPGESLKSFFRVLAPSESVAAALYVLSAAGTLYIVRAIWRSRAAFDVRASALIVGGLLISPHAFPYDLLLLAPVYWMLTNWLAANPSHPASRLMAASLIPLFFAPVLGVLPAAVRLQCSTTAMMCLMIALRGLARSDDAPLPRPSVDHQRSGSELDLSLPLACR